MNTKKGIAPILIALIVAVVLGGGYAVVKTNSGLAKKLGVEKQVDKKEAIADKKEAKKDETAGWKTYTNEKYGFEVEYPDQWTIAESSVKNSHPENSTSFMTMIMGYVKEPDVTVSVSTEKAKNAIAKIQKIIDAKFSYDISVSEVAKDISKESSRYQVYNFTNPNGVKVYSYSFVGKYSETSRHFFFDTGNATIVFSITSDVSCSKGCTFATENEAFLAAPALRHWIDSVKLSVSEQTNNWKTYKNEKYGFEVKHPTNWQLFDASVAYPGVEDRRVLLTSPNTAIVGYPKVAYLLQLAFDTQVHILFQGFIATDSKQRQAVEDITVSDAFLKDSLEYKTAQEIIYTFKFTE